jgi:hypothetical protein
MANKLQTTDFLKRVIDSLHSARQQVVRQVNLTMVQTYFEIGRMIVEEEQDGKEITKHNNMYSA